MKLVLFDGIGDIGIITDWKPMILDDYLKIQIGREGTLTIGDKQYHTDDGVVFVPQYTLILGDTKKITFTDASGVAYSCGTIARTGTRMIEISNPVEPCIVACCQKICEQDHEISVLKETVDLIKKQYGITII